MMELTIMTFNLRVNVSFDGDNAWPYRKQHAAELIRRVNPLVIGTQEGRYDMLRDLDSELPQYSRLGEGRSGYESGNLQMDECCAIFYRKDLIKPIKQGQFWLSDTPEVAESISWDSSYSRFCTWACFETIDNSEQRFYVFNTHFDHEGQQAREESAKLIIDRITQIHEAEGYPVLLTGDFNSYPNDLGIIKLQEALIDASTVLDEPMGLTFHDYKGGTEGEPIDYLFFTQDVTVLETIVYRDEIEGRFPSDHYPIATRVRLA